VSTDPASPEPAARPQPLSVREGRADPGGPCEGVPAHLVGPLQAWIRDFVVDDLHQWVALRMGLSTGYSELGEAVGDAGHLLRRLRSPEQLLYVIDWALRLDPVLADQVATIRYEAANRIHYDSPRGRLRQVSQLDTILEHGNSTYQVSWGPPSGLVHRVDPTAQAALDQAIATTDETASDLLSRAWTKARSHDPDPDGAYHDAVRAVEVLACPLVLPTSPRATLSTVTKHLRDVPHKWELTLPKLSEGSVEPLVAMFDRLWHGNLESRHGSLDYREVTPEEARAGVQLAILCVQWLSDGVLRSRTSTSGMP